MPQDPPLFELDNLAVGFGSKSRTVKAVRDVSLAVRRGETLGVVGESGSGKSVSLLGAFGLLPSTGRILGGAARFKGRDIKTMSQRERRALLGNEVAFVFQNPTSSLNPVLSIGAQLVEALQIHDRSMERSTALRRAVELLDIVGITEPEARVRQYPHEFSGGMCQRVMIALALANHPELLIADEPTTAVDATIQAQILELLRSLRSEVSGAVIIVSHDLGVIAENTDHLVVMYAGAVMEAGPTRDVLANPQHPYTQGLLSCRPSLEQRSHIEPIPGQPPIVQNVHAGCPFAPRCPIGRGDQRCQTVDVKLAGDTNRQAACHHVGRVAFARSAGSDRHAPALEAQQSLFDLSEITVDFPMRKHLFKSAGFQRAVDSVDVKLKRGEALGIVGESGSGKTTLARVMMRLVNPTSGAVVFDGVDVTHLKRRDLRSFRDRVQMVFQDPFSSLNPQLAVGANAGEPLRLRGVSAAERRSKVLAQFSEVGLLEDHYDRSILALSGGQLQRVGIARALVLNPDVLVMDEPVSALDVSVQAQILNLLRDLKRRRHLSYVFISHDMSVVRYLCDKVVVMHLGKIVESGAVEKVFEDPDNDYTRGLLDAVPKVQDRAAASGSVP